jgi:RNA polymerase sigma-70 factor, ECF subfamily
MAAEVGRLEGQLQQDYEQRLIQRFRDGEHEAFYQWICPCERRVYAAAFAILRKETHAEDRAQEAVLKAFKHIRQFRAQAKFSTWLIQIAVNEARMRNRKERAGLPDAAGSARAGTRRSMEQPVVVY